LLGSDIIAQTIVSEITSISIDENLNEVEIQSNFFNLLLILVDYLFFNIKLVNIFNAMLWSKKIRNVSIAIWASLRSWRSIFSDQDMKIIPNQIKLSGNYFWI